MGSWLVLNKKLHDLMNSCDQQLDTKGLCMDLIDWVQSNNQLDLSIFNDNEQKSFNTKIQTDIQAGLRVENFTIECNTLTNTAFGEVQEIKIAAVCLDNQKGAKKTILSVCHHPHDLPARLLIKNNRLVAMEFYQYNKVSRHQKPAYISFHPNGAVKMIGYKVNGKRHNAEGPSVINFDEQGVCINEHWHVEGSAKHGNSVKEFKVFESMIEQTCFQETSNEPAKATQMRL